MATRNAESVDGRAGGILSLQAASSPAMGPLYRLKHRFKTDKDLCDANRLGFSATMRPDGATPCVL